MAYDPPRVRRVPPPPPPGFGDEEYYRLYGRPEDYHKYRQQMEEEHMISKLGSKPYPVHDLARISGHRPHPDDYYSYRDHRGRKDDYYYEPAQGRPVDGHRPRKLLHHQHPGGALGRDVTPELSSLEEEDLSPVNDLHKSRYENFRVTIRNESDGTPSLSGMDENTDISENENTDNGNTNTDDSDSEILSDEEDQSDEEDDLSDEKEKVRQKSVVSKKDQKVLMPQDEPKRLSVKDRLGTRRATSPVKIASQIGRDKTIKRNRTLPVAKQRNAAVSPEKRRRHPPSIDKASRDRESSRGRENCRSRDNSRGRESKTTNARSRTDHVAASTTSRRRDSPERRNRARSRSPPTAASSKTLKRRKRSRNRGRGGRGEMTRQKMENTNKENELMLRRLARKRRNQPRISESDKNLTLARLAGLEIPVGTYGLSEGKRDELKSRRNGQDVKTRSHSRDRSDRRKKSRSSSSQDNKRSQSRSVSTERENTKSRNRDKNTRAKSPSRFAVAAAVRKKIESRKKSPPRRDNKRGGGRDRARRSRERVTGLESAATKSKRSRLLMSRSHSRSRSRTSTAAAAASKSTKERNGASKNSPDHWQHDKFHQGLLTPEKEEDMKAFGTHWSKIRSERSKERDRRSPSSSDSRRSRSRRGKRRGRSSRSSSRRSRRRRSYSSYSRSSSSRSSSYSITSSSSGSVRRERRRHKAETRKAAAETALLNNLAGGKSNENDLAGEKLAENPTEKENGVNFGLSGKLIEDTNTVNGVVVKYSEPQEARKPRTKWRLYVFKGNEELPILYIHRQSAYLLGRDRKVADIPLDHPSCSTPKPEGLKKKEERDQKIAASLKQLRETRRAANKVNRAAILKRAQEYEANYQNAQKAEITARRNAKLTGQIHVPAESKLAFVIRIRGINKLNPKTIRILRLLRLRQLHNGTFVRVNKASTILLRKVEPYITFGYPSRDTIRRLIYKRGYGKVNKQRIPLSNNEVIAETLGKATGITSIEDLINEIYTVGPHFKAANNFLWPFKLRAPRGGFSHKRHPFQRRGDWGNREQFVNQLVTKML